MPAQWVDASGAIQWTPDGVALSVSGDVNLPVITPDRGVAPNVVLGAAGPTPCAVGQRGRDTANDAAIGGVKVIAEGGWFAARPSGTEDIYKIYAESFRGEDHLRRIVEEAQRIVDDSLGARARASES